VEVVEEDPPGSVDVSEAHAAPTSATTERSRTSVRRM
jgi:hypothetical protein